MGHFTDKKSSASYIKEMELIKKLGSSDMSSSSLNRGGQK